LDLGHHIQNELNVAWHGRKMGPKLDEKTILETDFYWSSPNFGPIFACF
jgi:hypothetical protein